MKSKFPMSLVEGVTEKERPPSKVSASLALAKHKELRKHAVAFC